MAHHQSTVAGLQVFLIVCSAVVTLLRCVSRSLSKAGFWWDDYTILLALVLCIGLLVNAYC